VSRQAAAPIEGLKTFSLKQVNGAVKEVVGKVVGDSKLEAGVKLTRPKESAAIGGLKDAVRDAVKK
jgi:uncharacterized protein YjbJ (UPF0337 family)